MKLNTNNQLDLKKEAAKMKGSLGTIALYELMRLVQAGNEWAIGTVLRSPKLQKKKLSGILFDYWTGGEA